MPVGPQRAYDSRTGGTPLAPGATAHVAFDGILPADASRRRRQPDRHRGHRRRLLDGVARGHGRSRSRPTSTPRPPARPSPTRSSSPSPPAASTSSRSPAATLVVDVTGYFTGDGRRRRAPACTCPMPRQRGCSTPARPTSTRSARRPSRQPRLDGRGRHQRLRRREPPTSPSCTPCTRATSPPTPPAPPRPDASNLNASRRRPDRRQPGHHVALSSRGLGPLRPGRRRPAGRRDRLLHRCRRRARRCAPEANPAPPAPDRIVIPSAGIDIPSATASTRPPWPTARATGRTSASWASPATS